MDGDLRILDLEPVNQRIRLQDHYPGCASCVKLVTPNKKQYVCVCVCIYIYILIIKANEMHCFSSLF